MKVNTIRLNMIPVVSANAVSWGCEVDHYGRNKPVQRAWILLPAYLFSLTRTDWPGETGMKIRDSIMKEVKESTASKMGAASSMSESEDAAIGGAPESSSSGVDR